MTSEQSTTPGTYHLVYQCGIANIFQHKADGLARRYQGDFRSAENMCHGLSMAGAVVLVSHCDKAGNIQNAEWVAGRGSMFEESKHF